MIVKTGEFYKYYMMKMNVWYNNMEMLTFVSMTLFPLNLISFFQ
jgi:hypothetical protein